MNEEIKKELEQLSPILAKVQGKTASSAAPSGYLDAFEDNFFEKLNEAKQSPIQQTAKTVLFRPWMPWVAAASVLLAVGFWWMQRTTLSNLTESTAITAELSDAELENYILENIEDFDLQTLALMQADETVDEEMEDSIWLDSAEDVLEDISLEELEQLL